MVRIYWILFLSLFFVQSSICKTVPLNRIVNGKDADAGEFQYQLSLRRNGRHICGASVLNSQWALTAAHCVEGDPKTYSVRAGSLKRTTGGTVMNLIEILSHPLYEPVSMNFDVALLRTQNTLRGDLITPITLPRLEQPIPLDAAAVVSGWGHISTSDDTLPDDLKYVQVYTVDQEECARKLYEHGSVTNAMFCAAEEYADACQGDSGGPINLDGVLIGVVSWGIGCGDPDYPGVYTNLAYPPIRNWIRISTRI